MGQLDDAIREHLELKRRHGADPSEIDRLEHEALGPVRRPPFEPTAQKSGAPAGVNDSSIASQRASELSDTEYEGYYEEEYDDGEAAEWGEGFDDDLERPGSRPLRGEPSSDAPDRTATKPPPPEHGTERRFRRWRFSRGGSVPPEETPPMQADSPAGAPRRDEAVAHSVEDSLAARGGKSEEGPDEQSTAEEDVDVLEETPEFLQDAPEHDRLWFEQRPPRDFDFDD